MLKNLIGNKVTPVNINLPTYNTLLKSIWTYRLQLWGNAKKSDLNKIQAFQNMTLRKLLNASSYILNHTLHIDCILKTIHDEAVENFTPVYLLIQILSSRTYYPSQSQVAPLPLRQLKRKWCRDL